LRPLTGVLRVARDEGRAFLRPDNRLACLLEQQQGQRKRPDEHTYAVRNRGGSKQRVAGKRVVDPTCVSPDIEVQENGHEHVDGSPASVGWPHWHGR